MADKGRVDPPQGAVTASDTTNIVRVAGVCNMTVFALALRERGVDEAT